MADNVSRITIKTPIEFFDELPDKVDTVIIGGGIIGISAPPI